MTGKVTNSSVELPQEALEAAGLSEGDSVYVYVDSEGAIKVEPTRVYESTEAFIASLESRIRTSE